VNVDIVQPGDDVSHYKLVLTPHLHVLPDAFAEQLVEYVKSGGVLLADCRTGVKDETNLAYDSTLPGLLSPALGIQIDEYESLGLGITDKESVKYKIHDAQDPDQEFVAIHYADWIRPTEAETMWRYKEPHLDSFAAVTRNEFGGGIGWYIGTISEQPEFYDGLIAEALMDAKIEPLVKLPLGVEAAVREADDRALLFLVNHTAEDQSIAMKRRGKELLSDRQVAARVALEPFGVAIIRLEENVTRLPPSGSKLGGTKND
jgi:beta-galactosidase